MATIDYGSDYSTFRSDGTYGMTYRRITGPRVPLEGVVRRWLTQPADPNDPESTGDAAWDEGMGFDLTRLLNSAHTDKDLSRYAEIMRRQATRVDFVAAARVGISNAGNGGLAIEAAIFLDGGGRHVLLVNASQAAGIVALFPTLG